MHRRARGLHAGGPSPADRDDALRSVSERLGAHGRPTRGIRGLEQLVPEQGAWYLHSMLREGVHEDTRQRAQVFLDARGILRIIHSRGSQIELDDVLWIRKRHLELAGTKQIPVLVDARNIRSMSLAARRAAAGPDIARITSRLAMLVGGPVSAVIGNFFMRVARPPYPARLFTDLEAADAWLLEPSATTAVSAHA